MRQLLLSDIHANMEALEACLERAAQVQFDAVLCCGDLVGYGPEPNETVDRLRDIDALTIRGNHDRVACGQDDASDFNPYARSAAYWTRETLREENKGYLRNLPKGPVRVGHGAQLVHGAITDEDDYIMSEGHAAESFALTQVPLTFFGHTHYACVFSCDRAKTVQLETPVHDGTSTFVSILKGKQYLANPGSVGQPRDGDPRASFAVWDPERARFEFYRVEYPVELTQEKMRQAALPQYLIDRLTYGR